MHVVERYKSSLRFEDPIWRRWEDGDLVRKEKNLQTN
jgi:hypothetical protein